MATLTMSPLRDNLFGTGGDDYMIGNSRDNYMNGGTGNDVISGGLGDDVLTGWSGSDTLRGDAGNDHLYGFDGTDRLYGGAGNDYLAGYRGNDYLYGGTGKDTFYFGYNTLGYGVDTIRDFNVTDDTIRLENNVFRYIGWNDTKLAAKYFHVNNTGKAHDGDDHVIYDTDSGKLYYDRDGTGPAAGVCFANISKGLKMTHADFYII